MGENGTPKKKKKKEQEESEEEGDSEEEYYRRYETVESMGELMHCVDLVGRFQRHKYCNMIEDPFVRGGVLEYLFLFHSTQLKNVGTSGSPRDDVGGVVKTGTRVGLSTW